MFRGSVFIALLGVFWGAEALAINCPHGYVLNGPPINKCVPALLQSPVSSPTDTEFTMVANEYPICGPGRVPLSADGNYTWSNYASSGKPRSDDSAATWYNWTTTDGYAQDYHYVSTTNPNEPYYAYGPGSRCYCLGKGLTTSLADSSPLFSTYQILSSTITSGGLRQYPVTFDVINAQDYTASQLYGPIPIAKTPGLDPRAWSSINGGANATCGCPNINEDAVPNGNDTSGPVGTHCAPMVLGGSPVGGGFNPTFSPAPSPTARVLAAYDYTTNPTVISTGELIDGGTGNIVASVRIPSTGDNQDALTSYIRRIWTCASPYELNSGTKACEFVAAHHKCDNGSGGQASTVSDLVAPTPPSGNYSLQFDNTVNKKLACCMNSFHTSGTLDKYEKFDCIDNSTLAPGTSFDDLWSSTDDVTDGGQLNALMLADSVKLVGTTRTPRIISGFYSMTGQHCDQFSEFAFPSGGGITRYKVDPMIKSGQQTTVGAAPVAGTVIPVSNSTAWSDMNAKVTGTWGKTFPNSAKDYLACPILVRAAITAACPGQTAVPNALTAVNRSASGGPRCSVAGGIQIHVRIEQVYEISGTPSIKTVDSVAEVNTTSSIDISKMILEKTGDVCPPNTSKRGDQCVY